MSDERGPHKRAEDQAFRLGFQIGCTICMVIATCAANAKAEPFTVSFVFGLITVIAGIWAFAMRE